MGSRGIVSFNQRIIFIEGKHASADRAIYEAYYPPARYNLSFVPAGDSSLVRKTAEQVNALLTASVAFQQYFSIVDGDIDRYESDPSKGSRLFRLPVYHVENFLLNDSEIFEVTQSLLGTKCMLSNATDVSRELESLLLGDIHLKSYAKALFDAQVAAAAKRAYDAVYKSTTAGIQEKLPSYSLAEVEASAKLTQAVKDGTWRRVCKGRDLLIAYSSKYGVKYEHFRNYLIARLKTPPIELSEIMEKILR
jgi:hypothetical protein